MIILKRIKDYVWGLLLIAVGIIFGINALGIAKIDIFFEGWWTLFIIIPSFISLIEDNDKKTSLIFLIVGILLLLSARDIISFALLGRLIVPLVLILIGLSIIFKKNDKQDFKEIEIDKNIEEIDTTFSEKNIKYTDELSNKALSAIFGKIIIDFREAKIKKEAYIKAEAIFGSIEILVPEGYNVKIKNTCIFGGVTNNVKETDSNKTIYVEATSIFGGVVIR